MDVEWLDLEELEEKEDIEMCEAEKRWLEVKSKEWKAEGIELGIKQGIEQGVELGQVLLYKTMLKNGMSVNEISKVCSISVESLKRVLNN